MNKETLMFCASVALFTITALIVVSCLPKAEAVSKNVCIETHLSLNKHQSEILCGKVTEL